MKAGIRQRLNSINPGDYTIVVLSGGSSTEREISLISGKNVAEQLEAAGFFVIVLDPAKTSDLEKLIKMSPAALTGSGGSEGQAADAVFLCLHGKGGEDGTIQGFLKLIGLPFTGCDVWSSATSIDKTLSKELYMQAGLSTPPFLKLTEENKAGYMSGLSELSDRFGDKCVVKAALEGSSIGVYITQGEDELRAAINDAFELDSTVLVEKYVYGRECTVSVLDGVEEDGKPFALPVIEIIPKNASYDFESKYAPGGCVHVCPAEIGAETTRQMQDAAVCAHKVLRCKDVSRSDFILGEDGKIWLLETNTIPGMTSTSLLPDAAAACGISFQDLCAYMAALALK